MHISRCSESGVIKVTVLGASVIAALMFFALGTIGGAVSLPSVSLKQQSDNAQLGTSTRCPSFDRPLMRGASGDDVAALQSRLMADGAMRPGVATKVFGPITETALRAWQRKRNIDPLGAVGPKTRRALNLCTASTNAAAARPGLPTAATHQLLQASDANRSPDARPSAVTFNPGTGAWGGGAPIVTPGPVSLAVPVVVGAPAEGQSLTVSSGTWSPSQDLTFSYQWLANGIAVTGATGSSFTPTRTESGASLTVRVTATSAGGSASATSASTQAVRGRVLDLDFVNGVYWDVSGRTSLAAIMASPRTFGIARYRDAVGNWLMAATDTPRLNGQGLGLLVEPSRQNIARYSRDLTRSDWIKTNVTATLGQIGIDGVAPSAATRVVLDNTAATTWSVPSDWDSTNNTIEIIGPGGNGANATANSNGGGGGGGGAYAKISNATLTPGSTIAIQIPAGGAEQPALLKDNTGTVIVSADYGRNAVDATRGAQATAGASTGTIRFSGGLGGTGSTGTLNRGGGGGGGAGGPTGSGGTAAGGNANGGGGGSGADNGASGSSSTGTAGGAGGNGPGGTGAGAGGTATSVAEPGTAGSGAGGGGGFSGTGINGAAGSTEALWDSNTGPGGGGGGGGKGGAAGVGARYGAGGGGGGATSVLAGAGAAGGQGVIVITYGGSQGVTQLTATANNAIALQASSASSQARTTSMWVKRISGTGQIFITMDAADTTDSGGTATWTPVTVTGSWTQVRIPSQTLANPIFGIKFATSGDAIAVDGFQVSQGLYPTSPIFTTNATAIRPSDAPYVDLAPLLYRLDTRRFTILVDFDAGQINSTATMAEFVNKASPTTQRHTINYRTDIYHTGWTVVGDTQGYDPQPPYLISLGQHKFAGTVDAVSPWIAVSLDGSPERTGSPSSFPTGLDHLNIGHQNDSNHLGGHIRRLRVYSGTSLLGEMTTLSTP